VAVVCHHVISLDGYVAGPDDSMEWTMEHGSATALAAETGARIGAVVAGRRWHDLAIEYWNGVEGIYGGEFEGTVFVLTHRPPAEGERRVVYVSGGIEEAISRAAEAAGGKDVGVFGGELTRQCLAAGLLDEIVLHQVPALLGGGVPLFGDGTGQVELERVSVAEAEEITDLRFRVRR
jgi:dihydrofolate reductase